MDKNGENTDTVIIVGEEITNPVAKLIVAWVAVIFSLGLTAAILVVVAAMFVLPVAAIIWLASILV